MTRLQSPPTGRHFLDACLLGPYGENDTMLEKLVVEGLRNLERVA